MPLSGLPRNVFVYDANVPDGMEHTLVAGIFQFGQTTGAEFYFCLEIDPPQYVSVILTVEVARPRTISGASPASHGVHSSSFVVDIGCTVPGSCS